MNYVNKTYIFNIKKDLEFNRKIKNAIFQQRMMINESIEEALKNNDINVKSNEYVLFGELTNKRRNNPEKYNGNQRIQRAGIIIGNNSVKRHLESNKKKRYKRELFKNGKLKRKPKNNHSDPQSLFHRRKEKLRPSVVCYMKPIKKDFNKLRLPGLGTVETKEILPDLDFRSFTVVDVTEKIYNNTAYKDRKYQVHICCRVPVIQKPLPNNLSKVKGVDFGVVNTVTESDGNGNYKFHNAPFKRKKKDYISILRSRANLGKKRGSRRYKKIMKKTNRLSKKLINKQINWERHTALEILKNTQLIGIEDLNLNNMSKSSKGTKNNPGKKVKAKTGLNRELRYNRLGFLRERIKQTAENLGVNIVLNNPRFSSITCPECGSISRKNRENQANFSCQDCGHTNNADANAARNHAIWAYELTTKQGGWDDRPSSITGEDKKGFSGFLPEQSVTLPVMGISARLS